MRPTDVVRTAAGLTVEVTNPDAEGRLILADALWWARRDGATHLVDIATLTGALRAGMGDLYAGVFGADESWRDTVVQAGNASGDLAWPWPLHPRYRPLIDSTVADLRNTAGKSFGFPIFAATFLQQFAGQGPWAHVDMLGPAHQVVPAHLAGLELEAPVWPAAFAFEFLARGLVEPERGAVVDRRLALAEQALALELELLGRLVAGIELAGSDQGIAGDVVFGQPV